nr:HAD family hydrolase [Knoellia sp. DB2414S]
MAKKIEADQTADPSVTQVVTIGGIDQDDLLRLVAGVERASEHPLGLAIVNAATDAGLPIPDVTDFDASVGKGPLGTVEERRVGVGSAGYLTSEGLYPNALRTHADQLRADRATVLFAGVDDQVAGIIAIADPVKGTPRPP